MQLTSLLTLEMRKRTDRIPCRTKIEKRKSKNGSSQTGWPWSSERQVKTARRGKGKSSWRVKDAPPANSRSLPAAGRPHTIPRRRARFGMTNFPLRHGERSQNTDLQWRGRGTARHQRRKRIYAPCHKQNNKAAVLLDYRRFRQHEENLF